jgi:hypothetical protein
MMSAAAPGEYSDAHGCLDHGLNVGGVDGGPRQHARHFPDHSGRDAGELRDERDGLIVVGLSLASGRWTTAANRSCLWS